MGLREDVATLATRIATELKTKAATDHTHDPDYIILNSGDPLPPGTPDGTLVFRRA
jgi:hypothetical protein